MQHPRVRGGGGGLAGFPPHTPANLGDTAPPAAPRPWPLQCLLLPQRIALTAWQPAGILSRRNIFISVLVYLGGGRSIRLFFPRAFVVRT